MKKKQFLASLKPGSERLILEAAILMGTSSLSLNDGESIEKSEKKNAGLRFIRGSKEQENR